MLLAWAGFMVWIADRKKSEVLALFAVGLAYYTSIITRVGSFTLYSNLADARRGVLPRAQSLGGAFAGQPRGHLRRVRFLAFL